MARVLITSGPTRQYLDPVRYLTNASSGKMGSALVSAALDQGHQVTVVSGPVSVVYPDAAEVHWVVSTEEMLEVCGRLFPQCDGLIGAAAPCDYRPIKVADQKIAKTGQPLILQLVETPDVVATLGRSKRSDQWVVGFALETEDQRFRAITKLEKKCCDMIVLNGPQAMDADENSVDILDKDGQVVCSVSGSKDLVAQSVMRAIRQKTLH